MIKKGQNVEVQIFFTINEKSTIFVQFCSNFQGLTNPWVWQSLKVWAKSDKKCRFLIYGERNLHFYILTFLKQQLNVWKRAVISNFLWSWGLKIPCSYFDPPVHAVVSRSWDIKFRLAKPWYKFLLWVTSVFLILKNLSPLDTF